jgi:alpha-N-arabinofuranosidase
VSARALVLAAPDIHAHNTFESPRRVEPQAGTVDAPQGGALVYEVRPASVTRLTVQLA